jgi:hypothetical protein
MHGQRPTDIKRDDDRITTCSIASSLDFDDSDDDTEAAADGKPREVVHDDILRDFFPSLVDDDAATPAVGLAAPDRWPRHQARHSAATVQHLTHEERAEMDQLEVHDELLGGCFNSLDEGNVGLVDVLGASLHEALRHPSSAQHLLTSEERARMTQLEVYDELMDGCSSSPNDSAGSGPSALAAEPQLDDRRPYSTPCLPTPVRAEMEQL